MILWFQSLVEEFAEHGLEFNRGGIWGLGHFGT